jgi:hypothetical protein
MTYFKRRARRSSRVPRRDRFAHALVTECSRRRDDLELPASDDPRYYVGGEMQTPL